jgi:hypothetical protein
MSDDEDDIAAILDLPLAKSEGEDIMDDDSKMATAMTKIDMTGDLIVMHENVTTVNMQGLHTGEKEEDIFTKEELPANNSTHLYDGKHETYQVARYDDMHMDVDTKYVTTVKLDVTIETNLKEVKNVTDRRGTKDKADNTYQQAMYEAYQEEDVNKTYPENNIKNISIVRVRTNKPPGTATFGVEELHTREEAEDPFAKEEPPADNKVLAKYEYEGKSDVQDSIDVQDVHNVPAQEELPTDNGVPTKYEFPHSGDVMTSQTETADVAKVFAYMDEAYNKKGAVTETTTYNNPKNHDMPDGSKGRGREACHAHC